MRFRDVGTDIFELEQSQANCFSANDLPSLPSSQLLYLTYRPESKAEIFNQLVHQQKIN